VSRARWIDAAFRPRSVAIVGASDNPDKIGGRPIKYMRRHGYAGRILPVNAERREVQGLVAYPSVAALPETPDLAIVCVPGEAAVAAVAACAARGVPLGVVVASGFAETGAAGRDAEGRLLAAARAGGMRIVGPNTQGTVDFSTGAIASFATLIGEIEPADGPIAIVSQSGAMSVVPWLLLREAGLGVRHAHATGNECDLTVADFAEAVVDDPAVRLVLLYLESVPDPRALGRAALHAARRGVPVLALKSGVSARGQAAASSHTGAVATEDRVLDAFFAQHGIVRVREPRELVGSARLWLGAARPAGPRVAAVGNSGAFCVMAADAAERHGLAMSEFAAPTRAALDAVLPGFASSANPVDLTAALLGNAALFGAVLPILAREDAADSCFISLPMTGAGYDVERFAADAAAFQRASGRPTLLASPLAATRRAFESAGVVAFEHDADALAALGQVVRGTALQAEALRLAALGDASPALDAPSHAHAVSRFLSEAESLAHLAAIGLPVVPHALCRDAEALLAALARLPAPWALKACSAQIPHKTELGLVHLGVAGTQQALAAFEAIHRTAAALGKPLDGVLVAPMQRGRRELMLGARWDDRFGTVVVAGDGGTYVEAMPDVATVVMPFDERHLLARLEALRMAPLWHGVRGEAGLPAARLADAAVRLGRWVQAQQGRVASVDVNPLVAGPGDALVAVDALVELRDDAG
jgi:acyl-CoA synthetase (NDP forming)